MNSYMATDSLDIKWVVIISEKVSNYFEKI